MKTFGTFLAIGFIVFGLIYLVSTTEENRQLRAFAKDTTETIQKSLHDFFGSL